MQVNDHNHSGLDCDPKKCNVADPHGNAEVVAERPLQKKSAGHRVKRREDQYGCFCRRLENDVEQQEDYEENDGQDDLQPLLGTQLKFVLSRPAIRVSSGKIQLSLNSLSALLTNPP